MRIKLWPDCSADRHRFELRQWIGLPEETPVFIAEDADSCRALLELVSPSCHLKHPQALLRGHQRRIYYIDIETRYDSGIYGLLTQGWRSEVAMYGD